ncbi:MAG: complex I NDUFA9 subunit family protein [Haloarculaceae archaeon]
MNVLVAGGTGFIGTYLCEELAERGHDVIALSRSPETASFDRSHGDAIRTVAGDVTARDSIEQHLAGVDCIVNLVALSPLFKPSGGDEAHDRVHRRGTENLVDAGESHGVERIVQMSALGADPDGPTHYIRAKGRAETAVKNAAMDWVVFRPSVVFGDGGEFVRFTKRLATPYLTPLPGGGSTRFQPIYVEDLVPMIADAVEGRPPDAGGGDEPGEGEPIPAITPVDEDTDPHAGRTYELGGPEKLTLAEVARLAHAADNKPVHVVPVPMPLAGVGLSLLDAVPGAPMGKDQYRSLQFDNTVQDNDLDAFGVRPEDLTTLQEYLGVTDDRLRELDRSRGEAA